jgi:DNA-binding response OmpR family regulator
MKILVVEDEKALASSIVSYLSKEQIHCEVATDYINGLDKVISYEYDCILLDIGLPGGSGITLLRKLRDLKRMDGVIIISAHGAIEEKLEGLKIGADDYIVKPFHLPELAARIEAVVRRKQFSGLNKSEFGVIMINRDSKSVFVNNVQLTLSKSEYELLVFLAANKNRVITKHSIAEHLNGDDAELVDNFDFLYAHVKNLKKKLTSAGCPDYIKTMYGIGYKFEIANS